MKPKISTGYLTPQAKKTTKSVRLSDTEEHGEENAGFNEDLFQALMKCPEKKNMVLQLLASNKEAINNYKQTERRKSVASPLGLLKSKSKPCESPTALLRRRALEQMNTSPSTSSRSKTAHPKSTSSDSSSHISSPVPFEKVLDGVIAYVEIKNRQDEDRSAGAKAVLKSMGAIVRERFSKDVTHVIFKDGSYSTFQKAKLLKVHLVSILWVEFCRKTMQRQSEKQYPAMRSGFDDETMVCSQMQKEYEDIIREEYRRSIVQGTPLPTTKSLIDRRRTLMTPSLTNQNSSLSTFKTAVEENSDQEVADINGFSHAQNTVSGELIMNDPDCFSEVSEPVRDVNESAGGEKHDGAEPVLKSVENIDCSDMDLTQIPSKTLPEIVEQKTFDGDGLSRNMSKSLFDRRKTICNSLISSDVSTNSLISSDKSTNVSNLGCFAVPKAKSKRLSRSSSNLVVESNESFIFGKNRVRCQQGNATEIEKTSSAMSELKLSSDKTGQVSGPKSSSMSSLQVSESHSASLFMGSSNKDRENVHVASIELKNKENSGNMRAEVQSVPKSLQASEFVTVRKRRGPSSASQSSSSDDSEIVSPRKSVHNGAAKTGELKEFTPKKLVYDCNSNTTESPVKKLVVNIEKSPLCDLPSGESPQRKTRRRTLAPKPKGNSTESTSDMDPVKSTRRFRKLYNPDDSICVELDDEKEREEKRKKTRKRKSDEVYVNPIEMLTATDKTSPEEVASESVTPPKRTRVTKKKATPSVSLNSSADEQKELLNEILNKKSPNTLGSVKAIRKSTRIVKPTHKVPCVSIPCTPVNRRSTLEFMSHSQLTSTRKKWKKKVDKTKLPSIVCTKLHKSEVQVFAQIVRKLGRFNIEDEVSDKTTHLVAGEAKRTINMLRAIARGCWVVRYEWILSSLEEGKWLPEEKYEVTDFSPAVQKCRLERQAFGSKYTMDIFETCPSIYISLSTNPRCSDLKELISICKGKVVNVPRMAKIVVGQYLEQDGTVCVNETWVLDCITFYRKMPFKDKYLMRSRRASVEV